jgi:hypothetical protein
MIKMGPEAALVATDRRKAEGGMQKAEGRRQKAEGGRQKAEGRRQKLMLVSFLLFTFYFLLFSLSESPRLLYPFQQLSLITYQLSLIPTKLTIDG